MILKNFKHLNAKSLKEAEKASTKIRSKLIAGGTDLLGVLKDKIHSEAPEYVINLKTVPSLRYIKFEKKTLRIGALTTLSELGKNKFLQENFPALTQAARSVGAPQIRNMATLGGNLCQEPRCWYYRAPDDQFHCMRKGGSKCAALLGDNRYHSIYGGARMAAPGCTSSCPGRVEIASYMEQVRLGNLHEAAAILLEQNPLPAMTGRICPHTCESGCNRKALDAPVSIRNVERVLGDYVLEHSSGAGGLMKAPSKKLKHKVAIVGSGPAGLSAAFYLAQAGYRVTVFDRLSKAGGMLAYTIPAYRLPKELVDKQIAALKKMGIQFQLKTAIGQKEFKELRRKYNAVFLATGAWKQKTLNLENAHLLSSGMEFLTNLQRGKAPMLGDNVLVIGGGNVAIDVAISVKRMGVKNVTMACLEAREQMPAFPEEIAEAVKEGIHLLPSWGPHRVLSTGGQLTGMELVRCTSVLDEDGRFHPSFDPAQKKTFEADQIILAIGQSAEISYADQALKTTHGVIAADPHSMSTSIKNVFAGGDVTSGPLTVIHSIASGRKAAVSIDQCLNSGQGIQAVVERTSASRRIELGAKLASGNFELEAEAKRCLNCSCVAVNASDMAPVLIALDAKIRTTSRTLAAEDFFAAGQGTSTVLAPGEIVCEIEIPSKMQSVPQQYLKFRIRNAIDFPIVSLAAVLNTEHGKFKDSRLVCGAVSPLPLRLREVEAFLEGKSVTEEIAAVAMELAVKEAQPIGKNSYKLQIVKTLLKRAILNGTA